ncbi:BON domain-containing protein [Myxococcota bacterium]|nr:BON domain-containing protein [Myxococcota bacterium]
MKSKASLAFVATLFSIFLTLGCGGGPKPYRLIAQAARSPERPAVFLYDKRLRMNLREALLLAQPDSAISVSPYVTGGHAYLVGWVSSEDKRTALERAAGTVPELLTVTSYLPVKPTGEQVPDSASELELKTRVVGSLLAASGSEKINITVEVLGTQAVLVGAVSSKGEIRRAEQAAGDTQGITGVTNFLTVPDPGQAKRFGGFLR